MIGNETKNQDVIGRIQQMTSTVNRCHVLGATVAAVLMLVIGWVSTFGQTDVLQIECEGRIVNLDDARELIKNANQWRRQYTVAYTTSKELDDQVDEITTWLPTTVDWQTAEQNILAIAERTEMEILAIGRGDHHVGKRLGVVSATSTLQGTYKSLCEFLNALRELPQPMACSEVRLHRLNADEGGPAAASETRCTATLSLRIPFAAKGTAAGQLLSVESKNAS